MKAEFPIRDDSAHYPEPIYSADQTGSGITLGCTHKDCYWRLERNLHVGEAPSTFVELFALYHPPVAA